MIQSTESGMYWGQPAKVSSMVVFRNFLDSVWRRILMIIKKPVLKQKRKRRMMNTTIDKGIKRYVINIPPVLLTVEQFEKKC